MEERLQPMETQEFTLEKSTVECYKIRHTTRSYWADITVDSQGKKGRISISSDYGNYANFWGACGSSFKQFLIDLPMEYAANKFGADRWFDLGSTLRKYKNTLLEIRREERMSAERAKEIWNEIKELEDCSNKSEFEARMWNQRKLMWMFDNCPVIEYSITPQFMKFWNTIWQVFINQMEKESNE